MKRTYKMNAEVKRLLLGAGAGIIFFLIGTLVTSFVLTKNDLSYRSIKYITFAVTAASAFIAGFIAKKKNRIKGIACGAIASSAVLALVYLILLPLNGFQVTEDAFLLLPSGLLFGVLGGVISSNVR